MFWKNKLTSSELFSYESKERRTHFRVYPSPDAPIFLEYDAEKVQIINISAGGLSFVSKSLKCGDSLMVSFELPQRSNPLTALVEVRQVDRKKVCHCHFKEINADDSEAIHQYVLKRQKEVIRSKKKKAKK